MTSNEKWHLTLRCMQLVRDHYHLLRDERNRRSQIKNRRFAVLAKWLAAIDRAYGQLRSKKGKSPARIRQDWLVARMIEMMIYTGTDDERIRHSLTGRRPVSSGYTARLAAKAAMAIEQAAEEEGLFDGTDARK